MREFRFLDDKRKTNGHTEAEEARWIELAGMLGIDLWASAQESGYWTEDGFWYPYPESVDPYAAWAAQQQWIEEQIAYWATQGYYFDAQTGAYYPMEAPGATPEAYSTEWPTQGGVEELPKASPASEEVYEIDDAEVMDAGVDEVEEATHFAPSVLDLPEEIRAQEDLPIEEPQPQPEQQASAPAETLANESVEADMGLVPMQEELIVLEAPLEPVPVDTMLEELAVDLLRPAEMNFSPNGTTVTIPDMAEESTIEVVDVSEDATERHDSTDASPLDVDFSEEPVELGAPAAHRWEDSTLQIFPHLAAETPAPVKDADDAPLLEAEVDVDMESVDVEWGAAVVQPTKVPTPAPVPAVAQEPVSVAMPSPIPLAVAEVAAPSFAPIANLEPVAVPGEHRVILHTIEGQVRRGTIADASLGGTTLKLSFPDGTAEELPTERLKAIFFMLAPGTKPAVAAGQAMLITLSDGRQVAGYVSDDPSTSAHAGFFVVPQDNRTNTERIFVFRHAVQKLAPQP